MANITNAAAKELRRIIEQVERLNDEIKGLADDVRDKFKEAKSLGFDVKVLRKILALRKKTKQERDEEEAILESYMWALGLRDTPLGAWADRQEAEAETAAAA